jgi:hypothetical protein
MGNEPVAKYRIRGRWYEVVGCWDKDTPENTFDFYDLYDDAGNCLNEGNPYYQLPTRMEVRDMVEQ